MSRLRVAYVGPFSFPSDSANSLRVSGVTRALVHGGASVVIGAGSGSGIAQVPIDTEHTVEVVGLGEGPKPGATRLRNGSRGLLGGARAAAWVDSLSPPPHVVIVYGTHLGYVSRLISRARHGLPVVPDVVEWYQPSHVPGGRWGPVAAANELSMRWVAPRARRAITISRYLQAHFGSRGCRTLRVPPLFAPTTEVIRKLSSGDSRVHLCYAGSPGTKDRTTILNALHLAIRRRRLDDLRIHLVGLTRRDVALIAGQAGMDTDVVDGGIVTCHGRLPNSDSRRLVAACDFSVLQRPHRRYTAAGFPSKVAESLTLGTPVLGNLTSDLSEVLRDGCNAVILADDSAAALEAGAARIIRSVTIGERLDSGRIRSDAAAHFDPRHYSGRIVDFLNQL